MTRRPARPTPAARLLRSLGPPHDLASRPDADLLDRFARYADPEAFETLLRRHAGTVYGVCRRMLANPADVDDAFQATFLVLVRKARAVRSGDRLGAWLYGVAVKVATRARATAARFAARHTEATPMLPDPSSAVEPADWLPILDAELAALPAKYREPLVLCELQGASRADAAKALRLPEGTVSSRLSRGRDMLRKQLLKRGTTLPAGGLGVTAMAAPHALLARTAELTTAVLTGAVMAGVVPGGPARLTDEVVKAMLFTKLKALGRAAVAVVVVTCAVAAGWPADGPAAVAQTSKPMTTPATKSQPATPAKVPDGPDVQRLQGLWQLVKYDLPSKAGVKDKGELAEMVKHIRLVVDGDTWWIVCGPAAQRYEVTLNATCNPKWIDAPDVKSEDGKHTQQGIKGIFRLTGDDGLELCMAESGDVAKRVRPAEFGTDDDLDIGVLTFRRQPLFEDPDFNRPVRERLVGEWQAARIVEGGSRTAPEPFGMRITPHHFFRYVGPHWQAYTYTLDTEKAPAWIDLTPVDDFADKGEPKPTPMYGVFKHGAPGTMALALGKGGKRIARPLAFETDDTLKVEAWILTRPGDGGKK